MEKIYFNQHIKCHAKSCKFYTEEDGCSLGEISVSEKKENKKGTYCDSYKKD